MTRGSLEAGWTLLDRIALAVAPGDRAVVAGVLEKLSAIATGIERGANPSAMQ